MQIIALLLLFLTLNATAMCKENAQILKDLALKYAILRSNPEVAKKLIIEGANVNSKTDDGTPLLLAATEKGDLKSVQLLLLHKADVNACNVYHETALMINARLHGITKNGDDGILPFLIHAPGFQANAQRKNGHRALTLAMTDGQNLNYYTRPERFSIIPKHAHYFTHLLELIIKKNIFINYKHYNQTEQCARDGCSTTQQIWKTYAPQILEHLQQHTLLLVERIPQDLARIVQSYLG